MKLINNNKIPFTIILLCFVLENCLAHPHAFTDTPSVEKESTPHHSQYMAYPPDQAGHHNKHQGDHNKPHPSFPPSEAPHIPKSTSSNDHATGHSSDHATGHSSSFSAAFSDILKGAIRGPSLTMPEHPTEGKQSSIGIEQICGHTDYPDVCIATIPPLLATHNFDVINVLEAAMKACTLQIKLTITKVVKHASRSPEIANAVGECKNQYNNALENLQRAMDALPSRDLGTVTVMLSAVMADVSTCESAFEDLKAPSSPMSKADGLVSITVSNCLSIANLIPY